MASENSALSQPKSSAMGIWNTPKDARMAKLIITIRHPAIRTGVIRGVRDVSIPLSARSAAMVSKQQS